MLEKIEEQKVTIIVITFNSEQWIEETLESINNQTFKNFELIISDDCSEDRTVEICRNWISKVKLVNVKILISKKNVGIVKNINKALKKSKEKWVKIIAGDDILESSCIEKNIKYATEKNYEILFSKIQAFRDEKDGRKYLEYKNNFIKSFFEKNSKDQFKELAHNNKIHAPTAFFNRKIFEKVGYFDEDYPMVEDYPMWLKLTKFGIKLNYMDEITVKYRIHRKSISNTENLIVNERMLNFRKKIYNNFLKKEIKNPLFHYSEKLAMIRFENIIKKGNKRKTLLTYLTYLLDPYMYIKILKKWNS